MVFILKVKIKETVSTGTVMEYAGNYIYENGALQFFSTPEGYATPNGMGGYDYVYQYKDHLGNVRLSYTDVEGNLEIVEENNYYPFGLKHKGYNEVVSPYGNSVAQKWKYNGVELDETTRLYEMPLRQYDPAIGRWTSIDPVTHHSNSTYNGFDNNPAFWADPSGATVEDFGNRVVYTGIDAQNAFKFLKSQFVNGSKSNEEDDDWLYDKEKDEYVWDADVTDASQTPNGYDYVGSDFSDIKPDWVGRASNGFSRFFREQGISEPDINLESYQQARRNYASSLITSILNAKRESLINGDGLSFEDISFDSRYIKPPMAGEGLGGTNNRPFNNLRFTVNGETFTSPLVQFYLSNPRDELNYVNTLSTEPFKSNQNANYIWATKRGSGNIPGIQVPLSKKDFTKIKNFIYNQ